MIAIWFSPNHHNVDNKHMWVCLVVCFLEKNKNKIKHALYYLCWTFVLRNNAKRHIPDSVPPPPPFSLFLFFFLCNVSIVLSGIYEYICAKQLCSHFSYTAGFRSAHAYCCNSNSLVTAAINLICWKFLFIYLIFLTSISIWISCWCDIILT